MRIAVLLCFPAWCHGEHGLPRPSLVQVSSRGTAHAKVKADSMSSTLAGFQKFTDALVDQYLKEGLPDDTGIEAHGTRAGSMTSETRTAIESVLKYIDSFFETADVQHNIDKATVQACTNMICSGACSLNATKVVQEAGRVATQKSSIQTCLDKEIKERAMDNQACVDWDAFRLNPDNELPVCVYKANVDKFCEQESPEIEFERGDLCDNKIKADEVADEQQLESMEDCLEDIHAWLAITKPKSDACDDTSQKDLPCQQVVEDYHSDHCEYAMVLKEECNHFDACVKNCNDACDQNLCDEIDIKTGARMADNETGERIICLLKVLLNETVIDKAVELSKCNDAALATRGYSHDATYADLASYFELSCQPSSDDPDYPPDVSCADRNQAVSLSTAYMEKLMGEDVPRLRTTDISNPHITDKGMAMWDSCASRHVCGSNPDVSSGWLSGPACNESVIQLFD